MHIFVPMRSTFKKSERLKKRKLIDKLFAEGRSILNFPIRLVYLEIEHDSPYKIQAGFSVSKRHFKKAVQRNRIKRLLREAYRKNKYLIYESEHTKKHVFMFIYVGKEAEKYSVLEEKMRKLLKKFRESKKNNNE